MRVSGVAALRDGAPLDGARIGGLYRFVNGDILRVQAAAPGEWWLSAGWTRAPTGAVIGGEAALPFPRPPAQVYAFAIAAKDRKDDVKLSGALHKLVEEGPVAQHRPRARGRGETLLCGQGEIHLNGALERLASTYNCQNQRRARRRSPIKRRSNRR